MVKLANTWIIMNPGGGPTPDKPGISVVNYEPDGTTSIFLNLRVADIDACYREWSERGRRICYASDRPGFRDPLLYARSGRLHNRGRPIHRPFVRPFVQEAARGSAGLAVLSRKVGRLDGWPPSESRVTPVMVVGMEPAVKGTGALTV